MSKRIELGGKRFGAWLVKAYAGCNSLGQPSWNCICDCGEERVVVGQTLREGKSVSCGCRKGELIAKAKTRHGQAGNSKGQGKTKEYQAWEAMKRRCATRRLPTWLYYGRIGIKVCERWIGSFESFFADMGKCPPRMSLDRIDPYGNYEPSNCRWADAHTQRMNQRPHSRKKKKCA